MNVESKPRHVDIGKLAENPWKFRTISKKDFDGIVSSISKNNFKTIPYPIIAKIDKKLIIVDGHARIDAAKQVGLKKIPCIIADSITTYQELRLNAFNLNKQGYSNPLLLSDMVFEDFQILGDVKKVADAYGVGSEYITSLLKIRNLHDDTKDVIQKIINVSRKKYQFLLKQLSPGHLSSLVQLEHDQQIQVVDWIFRDIMYGPSDESMVSIPSVYEIIDEIQKISQIRERKTYKKRDNESKAKDVVFTCTCGAKYDIEKKSNTIFEYVEQNNVIIKKEFLLQQGKLKIYSSRKFSKNELIQTIKNAYDCDVKVIVSKRD